MDVSSGSLAHLPVQYPVVRSRTSPPREGELLLASTSGRGDGLASRRSSVTNIAVLMVSVRESDLEDLTARVAEPVRRSDGLAADPGVRRGLAAYHGVLTQDAPRSLGFYARA